VAKNRASSNALEGVRSEESAGRACPECHGRLVPDVTRGETVCDQCGLVVERDEIDHGPEWRAFDARERRRKSRVGGPITELRHDRGLSTTIARADRDASGNVLSSRQRERVRRLRTWNRRLRVRDGRDRNLRQALAEVDRMGSALGLPETVRETAAVTYRRAVEADLVYGRSIEAVATAAVYAAGRQAGTPRSMDEVVRVSRVEKKAFTRAYRYVGRELGLDVGPADPAAYLRRYASKLDVGPATERRAVDLLRTGQRTGVTVGKNPTGLAAAAIYAAARLTAGTVTQAELCEVANVCEVTIRDRYQELLDVADEE
jgi:transcription initiation factor TFIIB